VPAHSFNSAARGAALEATMTQHSLSHAILAISVPSLLLALSGCAMKAPTELSTELEAGPTLQNESVDDRVATAEEAQQAPALDEAAPEADNFIAKDADRREAPVAEVAAVLRAEKAKPAADPLSLADASVTLGAASRATGGEAAGAAPAPTRDAVVSRAPAPPAGSGRADLSKKKSAESQRAVVGAPPPPPIAAPVEAPQLQSGALPAAKPADQGVALAEQRVFEQGVSSREEYTDHGVNPYTLATNDRHSTFSIDVDTASYTVARRKLQEGSLPPEEAVRVEEFVNYFNYDSYAQPTDGPFSVNMEAMPDPFRPGHHTLRVGVQGKELSRGERPPLHVTFLVDVSGSMQSADKLPLAKRSMHMMVDGLNEGDTVALATYAGQVARILEPTQAVNKRQIHEAIDRLGAGGSTAMSAGIDLAYGMAMETFHKGHENRVVVLSDGDANVGNSSFDTLLGQIKGYADKGVTLSTIGLGMGNYRDTLMEQLANKGDGNNFYIDGEAQAQRVFVEELGGSMVTIARDVKIQVEFNPEAVAAYRLVGYENRDIADKDFRNDRVDAGEVGSGHDVTAIYDVILKDGYAAELATVRMRYEAPGADKAADEKAWRFHTSALKAADSLAHKDTRIAYAAATFAEVLRGSPTAAEISLDALIRYAQAAARPGQKDDQELISLMKRARELGAGERGQALSRR
jgi:Ca-activated chloride channel family protein